MNINDARELLTLLEEKCPTVDVRLVINQVDLMEVLKKEKYFPVLEQTAWNTAELHILKKQS